MTGSDDRQAGNQIRIGAHVGKNSLLGDVDATSSAVVQLFLSSNRSWSAPTISEDLLRSAANVPLYVHSQYLLNPASNNPEVRSRSRQALMEQTHAAATLGALGVVVHGGHPTGSGTVDDAIANWLDVLEGWVAPVPILVENTAGGNAAPARRFSDFARLFGALKETEHPLGVCLDTCHAWAGGEELYGSVERLRSFAGHIDLLHVNDSKDCFDSARDRHENLGAGSIPLDDILEVVRSARCDAIVETPNGLRAMQQDISLLRSRL
jgi:deoxyribonuclease-4